MRDLGAPTDLDSMLVSSDGIASFARSGWVPAAVVATLAWSLQLLSGTSANDIGAFSSYALLCLVLPGTLLWRLLKPIPTRLWLEDVVFGAILGYAVEIPAYLAARSLGQPLLVLLWPLALYVYALATRRGRSLWRRRDLGRLPPTSAWTLAAVLSYLVLFVARGNWWVAGVKGEQLRVVGPDASFQLALTGELRHHMPPSIPWVSGEPLHYHWLTYVHTASATWVTGVEPIIMLRRLAPLLMAVLIVLAVAVLARRLTRRPMIGLLAAALLVVVHSPAFYAAESDHFQRQEFTSPAIFGSPTMTFGTLLFCGVLALVFEVLRGRPDRLAWPVLALLLAATSGAKATFPPMVTAGALSVVLIAWLSKSLRREHLALLALTVVVWLAFQFGFYGGEDTGARLTPRGTFEFATSAFGAEVPPTFSIAALALAVLIVLLWSAHLAGMLGLLVQGGWRHPDHVFLVGFTLSGIGASLLLDLGAASQQWFVNSTQAATAVGAAVGISRLLPRGQARAALPLMVPAGIIGVFGMALGWLSTSERVPDPGPTLERLWSYGAPFLLTLAILLVGSALIGRRRPQLGVPAAGLLFIAVGLTSLGLFRTVQVSVALSQVPWERPPLPAAPGTTVGSGGVEASRWVRAHSDKDALLATNGHTLTPSSDLNLAFWLAGYAERRVLVESWGYTPHHSRIMADTGLGFDEVPFWDPSLLQTNDRAFSHPTERGLRQLHDRYGVSWLVLDKRFPSNPAALGGVIRPVYERGDYLVYDLARWIS